MTARETLALIAAGTAILVAGCDRRGSANDARRPIVGLESGNALSFTSSPDGGVMSLLYDSAVIEIPSASPKIPAGEKSQSRNIRMVLGQAPQTLRFQVRGFRTANATDAIRLSLKAGDNTLDLTPKSSEGNFTTCVDVTASKPTLDVTLTGMVKQVPGEDVRLDIDSIDIAARKGAPETSPNCV